MQLVDRECRWANDVRFSASGRHFDVSGPAPRDFDAIVFETEALEFRDALARNDISSVRDRLPRYFEQIGAEYSAGSFDEKVLGRIVLRGFADASERAASELRQHDVSLAESEAGPMLPSVEETLPHSSLALPQELDLTQRPQAQFVGLTIEQLWPAFAQDQVTTKKWRSSIAAQSFGTMRAWMKSVGVESPEDITSSVASQFRRVMMRLPSDYSKSREWRGLCFSEILTLVENTSYRPLAISTWNRHQSTMTAFWQWLSLNEVTRQTKCPFDGLWVEADENTDPMEGGSSKRAMWSAEQLTVLFE